MTPNICSDAPIAPMVGQDLRGSIFELGWSVAAPLAVLTGYSATSATTLAASVTGRSICRKNRRPLAANASAPQNCASNLVAGQTFANQCPQSPNGHAA